MCDLPIDDIQEKIPPTNDVEQNLPAFKVISRKKLLYDTVQVVDLTEDEFMNEFKAFLSTLSDNRLDVDARRRGTKTKSKSLIHALSIPVVFLSYVRIQQDTFTSELFRINFSSTMLYGVLTTETYKDDVAIYQLDDGTAKVDVYYRPSNNKMLDYLSRLLSCEDALRRKSATMNLESIPETVKLKHHLRLLISIAKTRCHTHLARLKLRTHCFVVGRPFVAIKGNIAVFAETILPDAELGYSCELFWKSFLLALYEPLSIESTDKEDICTETLIDRLSKMCL